MSVLRVFRRLRVVLSYEPGAGFAGPMAATFGGLCNQLYTHVGMLALALQSGSNVVCASHALLRTIVGATDRIPGRAENSICMAVQRPLPFTCVFAMVISISCPSSSAHSFTE